MDVRAKTPSLRIPSLKIPFPRARSPMSSTLRAGALCAALVALAACGAGGERGECTLIGSSPGLRVEVKAPYASRVASASLRVCWNGACHEPEIELGATTTSVPMGCDDDEPDAACAASASPDGGKADFVRVESLPAAPVQVTLTLRDRQGRTLVDRRVDVTPEATFPNGEKCPEGPPQARLTVAGGTVTTG